MRGRVDSFGCTNEEILCHQTRFTKRLRNKPDTDELNSRKDALEEGRETPAPGTLEVRCGPECDPSCDDVADEPSSVVKSSESRTMLGMCQFGKKKGCTSLTDLNTETNQKSSRRKHCEILRRSLKGNSNQTSILAESQ